MCRLGRLILALAVSCMLTPGARADIVELELVLAIDVSASIDDWEYELQIGGLADAFLDEAVIGGIEVAGEDGIAVMMFQWSSVREQAVSIDWTLLRTAEDARRFSEQVRAAPRLFKIGGTSISGAVQFAQAQLSLNRYQGRRRIIDVSGDGLADFTMLLNRTRDRAVHAGIRINALAILDSVPHLDVYYEENLIGGPYSFVEVANGFKDYPPAIHRKLIREISPDPVAIMDYEEELAMID
jgi:hypothetical protein